jgi:hypothetical protein
VKGEVLLSGRKAAQSDGSLDWPVEREPQPEASAGYVPRGPRDRSYGKSTQAGKRAKLLKWVESRRERSG